jgi:hypothetical protein
MCLGGRLVLEHEPRQLNLEPGFFLHAISLSPGGELELCTVNQRPKTNCLMIHLAQ